MLDALFGIVNTTIDFKDVIYSSLIGILTMGADRRFPLFNEVMEEYIMNHLSPLFDLSFVVESLRNLLRNPLMEGKYINIVSSPYTADPYCPSRSIAPSFCQSLGLVAAIGAGDQQVNRRC